MNMSSKTDDELRSFIRDNLETYNTRLVEVRKIQNDSAILIPALRYTYNARTGKTLKFEERRKVTKLKLSEHEMATNRLYLEKTANIIDNFLNYGTSKKEVAQGYVDRQHLDDFDNMIKELHDIEGTPIPKRKRDYKNEKRNLVKEFYSSFEKWKELEPYMYSNEPSPNEIAENKDKFAKFREFYENIKAKGKVYTYKKNGQEVTVDSKSNVFEVFSYYYRGQMQEKGIDTESEGNKNLVNNFDKDKNYNNLK